jgi:RimJ/RimL family protein N-acetyltransferase
MIPRLETERLILREITAADFEVYAAFLADAEVTRYLPSGAPLSRLDVWRGLSANIGQWVLRGYGPWAVERKSDGAFIGRVGIIHPDPYPGLEVGWTLGREFWGCGYATEAARAAMGYAFLTLPVADVNSNIHPENVPSQKVALRLGETKAERVELTTAGGKPYIRDIWRISRAEWQRRRG